MSKEASRRYRAKNLELCRERTRRNYRKNKDKYRAKAREYSKQRYAALGSLGRRQHSWKSQKLPAPTRLEPEWCEGCGRLPQGVLCLDHDHQTGAFRGWLCHSCNRALGLVGDDIASVEKLLAYLRRCA